MFLLMTAESTYLSLLELPGTRWIRSKKVSLYYLDSSKDRDTEKRFSAVRVCQQNEEMQISKSQFL